MGPTMKNMKLKNRIIKAKKSKFGPTLVALILVSMAVVSCNNDDEASSVDCSGTTVPFTELNTIIQSSCAKNSSCHGSDSGNGPGPLLTYSQIYSARSEIRTAVANGSMPQGSSLSSNDKNSILCWIENGATNN